MNYYIYKKPVHEESKAHINHSQIGFQSTRSIGIHAAQKARKLFLYYTQQVCISLRSKTLGITYANLHATHGGRHRKSYLGRKDFCKFLLHLQYFRKVMRYSDNKCK